MWVVSLLSAVFLAFTSRAEAQPAEELSKTILLLDGSDEPIAARVSAELTTLGFEVKTVRERRLPVPPAEIELLSHSVGAVATIGVDLGTGDTRVWTMDGPSERMVLRAITAVDPDPAIAALRAVEALRTLLNGIEWRAASPLPEEPKPAPHSAPATPDHTIATTPNAALGSPTSVGVDVSIGPALAGSRGDFGASWEGLIAVRWLVRPLFGLEMLGLAPITSSRWHDTEGAASLTLGMAATGFHCRPVTTRWAIVDLGAGVGVALMHTESSPGAGYVGHKRDTFAASPFVRIGYAYPLSPSLSLRADLAASVALPRPVFVVAERSLSPWGWPLFIGSIGVAVALH